MSKSLKNYITIKVASLSGPPALLTRRGGCPELEAPPRVPRSLPLPDVVAVVTAALRAWDCVNSRADCSVPWVGLQQAGLGG